MWLYVPPASCPSVPAEKASASPSSWQFDLLSQFCYVEHEASAATNLVRRMEAKELDAAPLWSDLRTFVGRPWRGLVDLIIAGYPCQPFSVAGRRLGERDPRHLWPYVRRTIEQVRPPLVFLENVPGHLSLGWDRVYRDLTRLGYRVEAGIFSASEVGAPHKRERMFALAVAHGYGDDWLTTRVRQEYTGDDGRREPSRSGGDVANAQHHAGCAQQRPESREESRRIATTDEVPVARTDGRGLADANGNEHGPRRGDAGEVSGLPCDQGKADSPALSGGGSGELADARRPRLQRRRVAGVLPCEAGGIDGEGSSKRKRSRDTTGDSGTVMAHADRAGQRKQRGTKPARPKDATAECVGNGLVDATGDGRRARRTEPAKQRRRDTAPESGGELGNTHGTRRAEAGSRSSVDTGSQPRPGGDGVGNTNGELRPGTKQRRARGIAQPTDTNGPVGDATSDDQRRSGSRAGRRQKPTGGPSGVLVDATTGDGSVHAGSRRKGSGAAKPDRRGGTVDDSQHPERRPEHERSGRSGEGQDDTREATGGLGIAIAFPIFPPGPNERERWRDVIEISQAFEPAICGMAHGMAYRIERLRMLGGGVVPLSGGFAFILLAARFMGSAYEN